MATLKGQTIAASYQDLVKRADTYSQTGTNIELMNDSGVVQATGLYLESGATTDFVGIGVADPDTALEILDTTTQLKLSYDATNYATFGIESDGLLTITTVDPDGAEADIILAPDGKVGIGTASPGGVLQIDAGLGAPSDLGNFEEYHLILRDSGGNTNDAVGILFTSSADTYGGSAIVHYDTGGGGTGDLAFYTKQSTSAVAPAEVMRLTDDGKVGIKTTNPSTTLDVNGAVNMASTLAVGGVTTFGDQVVLDADNADLKLKSGGSGDAQIGFWDGSSNKAYFVWDRSDDRMELLTSLDFLIDTDTIILGNVGIGTTSPAQTLHVSSTGASSNGIRITNSEGSFEARVDAGEFYLYDVDDDRIPFLIDTSGKVGIGTTSPDANSNLHIEGGGYKTLLIDTSSAGGGGLIVEKGGTQASYYGTGGSSWLTGSATTDALIRAEANLIFATNGNNERMRIGSDGEVQCYDNLKLRNATAASSNGQSLPGYLEFDGYGWDTNSGSDPIKARISMSGSYSGITSGGVIPQINFAIQNSGDAGSTSESLDTHMVVRGDGVVSINASNNNKASLNVIGSGTGGAINDAKVYAEKNSSNDWN